MRDNESITVMPDLFDRQVGALEGLPDVIHTKIASVDTKTPVTGDAQTFTVQTYRQPRECDEKGRVLFAGGDTVFIQRINKDGMIRIALPPAVARAIARQSESLTQTSRSKRAKAAANARKDRGELFFVKKAEEVGA